MHILNVWTIIRQSLNTKEWKLLEVQITQTRHPKCWGQTDGRSWLTTRPAFAKATQVKFTPGHPKSMSQASEQKSCLICFISSICMNTHKVWYKNVWNWPFFWNLMTCDLLTPTQGVGHFLAVECPIHVSNSHTKFGWISSNGFRPMVKEQIAWRTDGRTDGRRRLQYSLCFF